MMTKGCCRQRKEEIDVNTPVPVYPHGNGPLSDKTRGEMSGHCAQTHADAFAYISELSDEAARNELRDMLAGDEEE